MITLKMRPPLYACWSVDVRNDLRPENIQSALRLLMEKIGQHPFALGAHENYGHPIVTFTAFVYYPHVHIWRLGTLHEFPKGYVGCTCGVLKPFDLFEKEDVNGPS